jgi:hypothetical protein
LCAVDVFDVFDVFDVSPVMYAFDVSPPWEVGSTGGRTRIAHQVKRLLLVMYINSDVIIIITPQF